MTQTEINACNSVVSVEGKRFAIVCDGVVKLVELVM